jgi:hypothetical protein
MDRALLDKLSRIDFKPVFHIPMRYAPYTYPYDYYPNIRRYFFILFRPHAQGCYVKVWMPRSAVLFSCDTKNKTHRTLDCLDEYLGCVYERIIAPVMQFLPTPIAEEIRLYL